ncbi:tail tube GTA-gp10-like protein [Roseibium hamelinense]|uniref:Tail tube GTA-gp10-like protein n=1 Tax=Roseibium hamelinense TaxID=150831 RepID=A0A562T737_9HYPH|nr:gene transfer agent family protein [Roseibium hamelinense]MTI43698.1 gene transfer agent family protein [Roseibium hamelinense]TWI89379.1 tail tube GTA-gp10-like protein [Roseibium hamelinense]
MANRLRGEISAMLDGRRWTLVLTLGALAELESAFACEDLNALVDRFGSGRLSARDMIKVLGAGLRGAGNAVTDQQVADMTAPAGVAGFAAIVADLIRVTFGDPEPEDAGEDPNSQAPRESAGWDETLPKSLVPA